MFSKYCEIIGGVLLNDGKLTLKNTCECVSVLAYYLS